MTRLVRSRWLLPVVVAAGVVVLSVLWYQTSRSSHMAASLNVATHKEGVAGSVSRINPLYSSANEVDADLTALIFSGLTRLGPDGTVQPDLAESWDISGDGLTYTFHLRQGVTWHDGEPFTADDVIFTYDALRDPNFRGQPAQAELFHAVNFSKVDDATVEVRLSQPFAPLLSHLTVGILPSHLLEGQDADALYDSPFNQQPVGTGPFRLTDLSPQRAVLEANTNYYLGGPYLRRFEFHFYQDEPALMKGLKAGEVQSAFFRSPLNADDSQYLQSDPDLQVLHLPSTTSTVLYFNDEWPSLDDKNVRMALAYATNRPEIISSVLQGQAVEADSAIAAGTWSYYPVLDRYTYDTDQAAKLLDEAGWTLQPNGIRAKDGAELRFVIVTNDDALRTGAADDIARSWQALGIPTEVSVQGPTTLLRDMLLPHEFIVAIYGFDGGPDPDPYPAYHSSQATPGGQNLSGFSDPQVDSLLQDARQSSDVEARKTLYRQFQEVFASEVPNLPLYQRTFTYAVDKSLQGVTPGVLFDSSSRFSQVSEWRLEGG
ncbi:MAG: peptide ABC transporter substrate-binding protein [Dehalococcoidia bacterium]